MYKIDVSNLRFDDVVDPDVMVGVAATEFAEEWKTVAHENLNKTAERYANNIQIEKKAEARYEVFIDDKLAVDVEEGAPAYDIKPGLLAGRDYVNVPLTYAFTPVGKSAAAAASKSVLPPDLKQIMAKGDPITKQIREKSRVRTYTHKTPAFSGLIRGGSGEATLYRRVSRKSDPLAFRHPGFQGKHLVQKAMSNFIQSKS